MTTPEKFNFVLSLIFFVCYAYQMGYIFVPFLFKSKKLPINKCVNRYAVLICARNEEAVLPTLIDSIKNQTYNGELITVFVAADNCTDNTAKLAKDAGAVVYERFNDKKVGKGYALQFLLENIYKDFGKRYFDGFFVFDADNVLEENYIEEMNRTFSQGYRIVTSYRNSKNYGDNWISAGYALWFLREAKYLNNSRMLLNSSCAVSGTGFLVSSSVLEELGGWNYFLLTEDIEFTVHNVINGENIGYCKTAMLYDEQPTTFAQSWTQRMRWARGYLQVFKRYGARLIKGIFCLNFSCYDMCMSIMPAIVLTALSIVVNSVFAIMSLLGGQDIADTLLSVAQTVFNMYALLFAISAITTITEWKRIFAPWYKKILYTFTFPLFMFTYIPISFVALFKRVKWSPIKHKRVCTADQVRRA